MTKCVLCNIEFDGVGHNAAPLRGGRCCDSCNVSKVIPMRIVDIEKIEGYTTIKVAKKTNELLKLHKIVKGELMNDTINRILEILKTQKKIIDEQRKKLKSYGYRQQQ